MGHGQWFYRNVVVHERGEGGIFQRERIILKYKMKLKMEMGRRGLLPEDKHLFDQRWSDLCYLPGKDKKLWLREVTSARNAANGEGIKKQLGVNSLDNNKGCVGHSAQRCIRL